MYFLFIHKFLEAQAQQIEVLIKIVYLKFEFSVFPFMKLEKGL
jgi:hypothetical protein